MNNKRLAASFLACTLFLSAEQMNITPEKKESKFSINGKAFTIERAAAADAYLTNEFGLTSRPSPPFFIQSFKVTDKVETYGELEVLNFLEKDMGVFIDARLPNWFEQSYIPGSVNIPFKLFLTDSPERDKILTDLGAKKDTEGAWDFKEVKNILLYCNGAWCGQSPTAIHALIKIGFPEEKMKYYRGGMQAWQLLGLSITIPEKKEK